MANTLLAWTYFAIYLCLLPVAKVFAAFNHSFARQIKGRRVKTNELEMIRHAAQKFQKRVIFFCSSAGEFEQALPLINRLEKRRVFTHTFFFSRSGFDYASARHVEYSYSKAPFDLPWSWKPILSAIAPDFAVVIRYELWPGFLCTASRLCPLYLINASQSHRKIDPLKKQLLNFFSGVFFVSGDELSACLQQGSNINVSIVGDTKYDRVLERAQQSVNQVKELRDKILKTYASRTVFVMGSCWSADVDLFLSAWRELPDSVRNQFAIILAPHDISETNLEKIESTLRSEKQDCIRFSRWMNDPTLGHGGAFLLIDTMGKLAEVYGAAHCAMVGGALHHKVHNVLEPASHGLAICFGPRYHSQKEAVLLVERGIAKVIEDHADLENWLLEQSAQQGEAGNRALGQVKSLAGATKKILTQIPELES